LLFYSNSLIYILLLLFFISKELKEFKAKISYLKKDIYFLNTLLNNDEEDFYIFMDKLLSVVNPSLFMDNKDSMNNSGEEHNHKRRHDNLEEQNQELFDDVNNKKVKLEHATEMLFDFDDEGIFFLLFFFFFCYLFLFFYLFFFFFFFFVICF